MRTFGWELFEVLGLDQSRPRHLSLVAWVAIQFENERASTRQDKERINLAQNIIRADLSVHGNS